MHIYQYTLYNIVIITISISFLFSFYKRSTIACIIDFCNVSIFNFFSALTPINNG
eukprot:UN02415